MKLRLIVIGAALALLAVTAIAAPPTRKHHTKQQMKQTHAAFNRGRAVTQLELITAQRLRHLHGVTNTRELLVNRKTN